MNKTTLYILFLIFIIPAILGAVVTSDGVEIGPGISTFEGRELKWEEGSRDFFVMFKSLLDRKSETYGMDKTGKDNKLNPQPDSCRDSSTFRLEGFRLPDDAYVTDAFLIWMGAQPAAELAGPTDNSVHLAFKDTTGQITLERDITAQQQYGLDGAKSFGFESVAGIRKIVNADHTALIDAEVGYYTYRVPVTDFFEEIHKKGREAGFGLSRDALAGEYTVSGLACADDVVPYKQNTTMVNMWAIVFVYTSSDPAMKPKKIYMYNGLNDYQNKTTAIKVQGFKLPADPLVRLTIMSAEGDSANYVADADHMIPEGLDFRGDPSLGWAPVFNICHPHREPFAFNSKGYDDIFNSISSFFNWNTKDVYCIGGKETAPGEIDPLKAEWALDVDTFLINNSDFPGHLVDGDTDIEIQLRANNDVFYTNLMVVSLDTKPANFDIPEQPEKNFCSCSKKEKSFCMESPLVYTIRVQNWGEQAARNVTVQDVLPAEVEYVAGTTEIASTFDSDGSGTDWTAIADGEGGAFPLQEPYLVTDSLKPCSYSDCEQSYMIRFRAKPSSDLPKHAVIVNKAVIADGSGMRYYTNSDVPVRLVSDTACATAAECASPDLCDPACGGCGTVSETKTGQDNGGSSDGEAILADKESTAASDNDPTGSLDQTDTGDTGACGCTMLY